jgi:hypothetical protein
MISIEKPFIVTKARIGSGKTTKSTVEIVGISNRRRSELQKPPNYKSNKTPDLIKPKDPHKNNTFKECKLTVNIWENTMNWITIDINPVYLGQTSQDNKTLSVSVLWFERDSCYRDYSKRFYISREVIRFIEINLLNNAIKKNILFCHFILKKKGLSTEIIMLILNRLF